MKLFFFSLITLNLLIACTSTSKKDEKKSSPQDIVRQVINEFIQEPYSDTKSLDVIYTTNRNLLDNQVGCTDKNFGVSVADNNQVSYGVCKINIPKKHQTGFIQSTDNPRSDSHTFFRVLGHKPLDEENFKTLIQEKPDKEPLVFIHGFNVKFEEAILRAAQITYDLKHQGPVILLSWPAGAGQGFFESKNITKTYETNINSAAASVDFASKILELMANTKIKYHVLVHSLGHQVAIPAITKVEANLSQAFIGELVLNAPDYDVDQFKTVTEILKKSARRVTLYCSYNDNAIAASEIKNRNRRMGACETADGIDVINVSEIDAPALGVTGLGHGYYSSRPILTDVSQILLGIEAPRRLFIRNSEINSPENYYLRP